MASHNLDETAEAGWRGDAPEAAPVAGAALLGKAFGLVDIIAAAPGLVTMKKLFARVARVSGEPRGLAVDPHGRLWVALHDGWGVLRLSGDGEIETTLAMPAPRPTGLAFGGADGATLFISTARYGLSMDALAHAPGSGLMYHCDAD